MVKLPVYCWTSCNEWLMPSCSLLVTALTFLQAGVVENMKKLIYHSQPEVTEASHSMLEGTEIAAFHKALGPSVVSLCSEYSLPSWSFCQQLRYIPLHSLPEWQLEPVKWAVSPILLLARSPVETVKTKACPRGRTTARMPSGMGCSKVHVWSTFKNSRRGKALQSPRNLQEVVKSNRSLLSKLPECSKPHTETYAFHKSALTCTRRQEGSRRGRKLSLWQSTQHLSRLTTFH